MGRVVRSRQRQAALFTQQWMWIFRAVSNHTGTGALFFVFTMGSPLLYLSRDYHCE